MVSEYGEPYFSVKFRSLLENKLNKEFYTKREDKKKNQKASWFHSLASLDWVSESWEASLARKNLDFPKRTSISLPVNNINIDYQKLKNFKLTINH